MEKRKVATMFEFYDPHPGFAGAAIPVPKSAKALADKATGTRVRDVGPFCKRVSRAVGKGHTVTDHGDYIGLQQGNIADVMKGVGVCHSWRLIRVRKIVPKPVRAWAAAFEGRILWGGYEDRDGKSPILSGNRRTLVAEGYTEPIPVIVADARHYKLVPKAGGRKAKR